MKELREIDLAWVAGVFDARGSCGMTTYAATKNGARYYRVVVRLTSMDQTLLAAVHSLIGLGNVVSSGVQQTFRGSLAADGRVTELRRNARKRLQILGGQAIAFLQLIQPYLRGAKAAMVAETLSNGKRGRVGGDELARIRSLRRSIKAVRKRIQEGVDVKG